MCLPHVHSLIASGGIADDTGKTEWVAHITIAHETYGQSEAVR